MRDEAQVCRLTDLVVKATDRGRRLGAERPETGAILAVARSLRQTLACVLEGRDLRGAGEKGFTAVAGAQGCPLVRHGARAIPGVGSFLQRLLKEAGVELSPREVILLDADLVKATVEEALSRNALCEAVLRQERSRLQSAYLAAVSGRETEPASPPEDPPAEASRKSVA